MRILSISRDRGIVSRESTVASRQVSYYKGNETDIVILATGKPADVELTPGIRAHFAGGRGNVSAFVKALRLARRISRSKKPDVVTSQDPFWSGIIGWFAARLARSAFQVQDHSAAFSRPTNFLAKFLARRADRVRTVSERGKRGLLAIGVAADRIDVIPIATDLARFRDVPPPDASRRNVLCIARLEPEKGVDILLRAWPSVYAQFADARLRIVGDGGERHRLELLARDLNIAEVVEFTGQHVDIRADLEWANVVAQPSHFEGWGLSVIEAAAAGRSVVMTDVGCAGEVIVNGTSGVVVPVRDAAKLGEGMIHLLHEPVFALSLAAAAKERVASLPSPDATAELIRASIARASQANASRPRRDRVALTIALLVFLASAGYAFAYRIRPAVDASAYDQAGWHIARGEGFRLSVQFPIEKDDIITYQGPLYEYVLAGMYAAFGHRWEAAWLLHALLRAATALLLVAICKKIFRGDARPGWIAAVLFGFSPDLIEIGAMLTTETVFIFLSILTVYFFMRAFERITWWNVIPLAIAFSAAILTRSTVILFSLPFLAWFIQRKAFAKMVLFGLICGALLTPWAVRNYETYHRFLPTMANFGYNFWMGNRIGGDGEGGNIPELQAAIDRLGPIDANYYAMGQFTSFVAAHPAAYAGLTASRTVKYFSFLRPMGFWFYQSGWKQAVFIASSVAWAFLLFVTSFAGVSLALRKERKTELAYLAAFGAVMVVPIVPILFETRYRLPIYPFLAIFGGLFLSRWWSAKREYQRDLITGLLIAGTFGLGSAGLEWRKITESVNALLNKIL